VWPVGSSARCSRPWAFRARSRNGSRRRRACSRPQALATPRRAARRDRWRHRCRAGAGEPNDPDRALTAKCLGPVGTDCSAANARAASDRQHGVALSWTVRGGPRLLHGSVRGAGIPGGQSVPTGAQALGRHADPDHGRIGAGGGTDVATASSRAARRVLRSDFVSENKPGPAGPLPATVAKGPKDGYSALRSRPANTVSAAMIKSQATTRCKDFAPVGFSPTLPSHLVSEGLSGERSQGLIEIVKKDPGNTLRHGPASAPTQHLIASCPSAAPACRPKPFVPAPPRGVTALRAGCRYAVDLATCGRGQLAFG